MRQERFAAEKMWSPAVKGNLPSKQAKGALSILGRGGLHVKRHCGTKERGMPRELQGALLFLPKRRGMLWAKECRLHPEADERDYLRCTDTGAAGPERHFRENSGRSFYSSHCPQFPDEETADWSWAITCLRSSGWMVSIPGFCPRAPS